MAFAIERGGLQGDDLLVLAGDNLIGYGLDELVSFWRDKGGEAAIAVHRVEDTELITQYGVAELDEDDRVISLEEKPSEPRSDLAVTASYVYSAKLASLIPAYLDEGIAGRARQLRRLAPHARAGLRIPLRQATGWTSATRSSYSSRTT